jgi:hypothetical protein
MDSAFLPRAQSDETLAWLAPHMAAEQPAESIIAAIEATGMPVYRLEHKRFNALLWQLCQPKTGFITMTTWQTRLAGIILHFLQKKPFSVNTTGFFWYPVQHISAAILSYDVHHWRMANHNEPLSHWQNQLNNLDAARHQVHQLNEDELNDLQRAVNQELDALTALRSTLRQQST